MNGRLKGCLVPRYRICFGLILLALSVAGPAIGQNQAPVFTDYPSDTTIAVGDFYTYVLIADDPDDDIITRIWVSDSSEYIYIIGGNNGTGQCGFHFNPTPSHIGVHTSTFYATDGQDTGSVQTVFTVVAVNVPPVIDTLLPQTMIQRETLRFTVTATDPNITIPALSTAAGSLPANATFVDSLNGTGVFEFTPDSTQIGTFDVRFVASDGQLADSMTVPIIVEKGPNRAPFLIPIDTQIVAEGASLSLDIIASDPDGDTVLMTAQNVPVPNGSFTDNQNNTGRFRFNPDTSQAGLYDVTFIVSDSSLAIPDFGADTMLVTIQVTDNTGAPDLDLIGPREVVEGQVLEFPIHAVDPDGFLPQLWYDSLKLPRDTSEGRFVDSANGYGSFWFKPKFWRQGEYSVGFYSGDGAYTDSETVIITVTDAGDQRPAINPIPPDSVIEGDTLRFTLAAYDPDDSTQTPLAIRMDTVSIPDHVSFDDSAYTLTFAPDCRQGTAVYDFLFFAGEGEVIDTEIVPVTVVDTGNWLPSLVMGPAVTTIAEGRLTAIEFVGGDCEGGPLEFWLTPPPESDSLKGNVWFSVADDGVSALFEFRPDYTQAGSYLFDVHLSDGIDTRVRQFSITVTEVPANANDPGEADTLQSPDMTWDGAGTLAIPITIANDSFISAAITGFRWYDPDFVCDSIVLGPILDNAFYKPSMIFPESLFFEAEFIFFDSQYIQPPGGLYFTAYFTDTGSWGAGSVFQYDSVKIGSRGDFAFDRTLKGEPPLAAPGEPFSVATHLSASTYTPLVLLGLVHAPVSADDTPPALPTRAELEQNFPNPFNPQTTIRFTLTRRESVRISIFNILGQKVATLADREYDAGRHSVTWDGRDGSGRQAASGIYLYQIKSEQLTTSRKMILLR